MTARNIARPIARQIARALAGSTDGSGRTPLLDAYGGSAIAFSLRKIRTDYSGACLRVRRSSDNSEQDIGFSGFDLDTASLLTFCGASNGFVTTWYDQSGNGNNASQTTTTRQPQIVSAGALISENGFAAIEFDGTNHWMDFTSLTAGSVFLLARQSSTTLNAGHYAVGGNQTGITFGGNNPVSTGIGFLSGASFSASNHEVTTRQIVSALTALATDEIYSNGILRTTGTLATIAVARIGNRTDSTMSLGFPGTVQQLIAWSGDQSGSRAPIEQSINSDWSVY